MKSRLLSISVALALSTAAVPFVAADEGVFEVLPEARVQNGVEFRAGGVGLDEREAMRAVAADYNLWLSFAGRGSNAYAADTGVVIRDTRGRVLLDVLTEGPWLMVKLPAGTYQVTAGHEGAASVTQRVTVRPKGLTRHVVHLREATQG